METEAVAVPSSQGFIYVIALGPYCKIGRTKDVARRLRSICPTKFPEVPILKFSMGVSNAPLVESLLHLRFNDKRVRGEWFSIGDADIEQIRSVVISNQNVALPLPVEDAAQAETRKRVYVRGLNTEEKRARAKERTKQRAEANRLAAENAMLDIREVPKRLRGLPFGKSMNVRGRENKASLKSIARKVGKRLIILGFHNLNGLDAYQHSIYGDTWELNLTNCWADPYVPVSRRAKQSNGNGHK